MHGLPQPAVAAESRPGMPQCTEVEVVVGSCVEYIDPLHTMAEEMARVAGLAEEERFHFALAVREAATNAIVHGNGRDPGKTVTVTFALGEDALETRVVDQGRGFDFDHAADPRLPENRGADGLFSAAKWEPLESGLLGPVTLTPLAVVR